MSPDKSLQNLFNAALDRSDAAERVRFLDEACGADTVLRERVEKLLRAQEEVGAFMAQPSRKPAGLDLNPTGRLLMPLTEKPGDMIGRYKLLQQIGEGGCGVVYMAEQEEPVRRRVALKVIKLGMDTKQVIARFEAERQALALMDHPNIAKVLDAGATETGRPYFVMELVCGTKLTEFCDQMRLTPRERLELFVSVCRAIQHAHQKGIIHRDIKPSNILVTIIDGKPVPKVIDFGIAKVTSNQRLTDLTVFTAFQQFIGTPAYMSPEQAEMSGVDIDTRTDIYSLGVVLYELLTSRTPFDPERLLRAGIDGIRRTIREQEPPRPSARLRMLPQDELTTTAQARQTDPPKLVHRVRGDLDWIAMKCIEKERDRRYETAHDLARDIERHLESEPVTARPPSQLYEFQKLVRRHRLGFAAATILVLVLCAGSVGTGWGLVRAERAREREAQRADGERRARREAQAAATAEREAKETALAREAETKAVLDFVEGKVFAAVRPEGEDEGLGRDISLRKAIESALPFVETAFTNQPLIEARLRMTVGWSFWCLGDAKIAAEEFQAARLLYTQHLGSNHADTLRSMHNLALAYNDLGRRAESLKLHEETLTLRKKILGLHHLDTLSSMSAVAFSYFKARRFDDAIQLGQEVLDLRIKMLGPNHPDTLGIRMIVAGSYGMAGQKARAIQLFEETLALQKARLLPHHPNTLRSMIALGWYYAEAGRETDALKIREEVLPLLQSSLGFDHRDTLESMIGLVDSYAVVGREAEAIQLSEEVLGKLKTTFGPTHAHTLDHIKSLARLLITAKDPNLRNPKRAADLAKELTEANPGDGKHWHLLGVAHYRASNWQAAVDALGKAMEIHKDGDAFDWLYLGMAHWQLGNKSEARRRYDGIAGWMNKHDQKDENLNRLRTEAAELLGVNESK